MHQPTVLQGPSGATSTQPARIAARRCPRVNHQRAVCMATQSASTSGNTVTPPTQAVNPVLMSAVNALFRFPPLFNLATKKARQTIRQRAIDLGMDWDGAMAELQAQDWAANMRDVVNPSVTYPSYYTQPFHAYTEGNMCWDAALEVTNAAKSVHALVMDPQGKTADPEGDARMRASYNQRTRENMTDVGANPDSVRQVVDLGCATGLSSLAILDAFPGSHVTGVDLSPYFLAVGSYQQRQRQVKQGKDESLTFIHGNAEHTGLPDASYDMVSMCLVCHELPQSASQSIFREAYRLLKPGGCLAVMEMDPTAPAWQRALTNPFAFAGFKSTEPWLEEYIQLGMPQAMRDAGFAKVVQRACTPRHKAVLAYKA